MKIAGYGEFHQMRKMVQTDDQKLRETEEKEKLAETEDSSDAVSISPEARRKVKLYQASDFRQAKVDAVRARYDAGTLVTPQSLKSGVTKLLDALANGDI